MLQIENADPFEQALLLEIVGASFDKICVNDEVSFASRYWRTKTNELELQNQTMVAVKVPGGAEQSRRTVKLYNSQDLKFVEGHLGLVCFLCSDHLTYL